MCVGNVSNSFTIDKKVGLKGYVNDFTIVYNVIDTTDILEIHKDLIKII